ncbi:hypothetical protein [Fimbriimonas ginsengisoli]|uniref:Glycoside hydrolase family protein n=1 Tax=Fimbriimonas ginsengisoli Gsoil 348 TaxID=661478 RepID=A0A068NXB6_FIMGI|nr:hypothetical protein [Fimbriimonas ginsengisoli]AIE87425.1 glycoside hydrolase family protein [Fimbriimonas ginsengisoli Gsoil 348]
MVPALLSILFGFFRGSDPVPVAAEPLPHAWEASESPLPLIPKPKHASLDFGKPVEVTNLFIFPVGRVRYWDLFKETVARRFVVTPPAKGAKPLSVDGGVSKLTMRPGGYTIKISGKRVSVLGEEDEGLRNGMYRLGRLVFAKGGKLWLPTGSMEDEPSVDFRGVQLFVGPEARHFQRRLWDRVLLPLGLNNVVLQCERTAWASTPIGASMEPMAKEELAGLFNDYRKRGIEPIPLIQSFGHMEWFFAGGKRLDLAVNQSEPYTIDPRKPGTKVALNALWDEAIALLQPKSVHFGCDEVDMNGMKPHDPALTTRLWQAQLPMLGEIAKRHGVKMMIWGDEALAPGEAPDATSGDDKENARLRRAAIPSGTIIADWHYKADPGPELFYPTLQLWRREGFTPIASTWYLPDNVRAFSLAATFEHAGTLQTTWAGYSSSEAAMVQNPEQFAAFVLSADYAWSGRDELPADLGYDPAAIFREMYYGAPAPVKGVSGASLTWDHDTQVAQVGPFRFRVGTPLTSATDNVLLLNKPATVHRALFAIDCLTVGKEGEPVAEILLTLSNGKRVTKTLKYGVDVRASGDRRMLPGSERSGGRSAVSLGLPESFKLMSITIRPLTSQVEAHVRGITLL